MTPFLQMTPLRRLLYMGGVVNAAKGKAVESTATGNPLSFVTDLAKPLVSLVANFLPVQSGTGDPSPTNVRPITGWDGLNVFHYPQQAVAFNRGSSQTANGITWTPKTENGILTSVHVQGARTASNNFYNLFGTNTASIPVGSYKVGGFTDNVAFRVYATIDGTETSLMNTANGQTTFTVTAEMTRAWMRLQFMADLNVPVDEVICPIVVNADEPITAYPVTWQTHGTIYGGYVDLVTGEVWATYRKQVFDGDEELNKYGSYTGGIRLNSPLLDDAVQGDRNAKANEAVLEWNAPSTIERLGFRIGGGTGKLAIFVPDSMFDGEATKDKFKTWLNSNNLEICITLDTPVLITTLTPSQITALVGNNTIWSDANGDCEVTFLKKG